MRLPNKLFRDYKKLLRLVNGGAVFAAIATETTGLTPDTCRIIEIGAVLFDKTGVLDTFASLVNPGIALPSFTKELTHITDDMLSFSPPASSVLPAFIEFIGSAILVAHNAPFDLLFINKELERSGMPSMSNKAIDTLNLSRWAYPSAKHHSLQYLAAAMGIDAENAHRASDDAKTCRKIFLRCLKDTESVQKK